MLEDGGARQKPRQTGYILETCHQPVGIRDGALLRTVYFAIALAAAASASRSISATGFGVRYFVKRSM